MKRNVKPRQGELKRVSERVHEPEGGALEAQEHVVEQAHPDGEEGDDDEVGEDGEGLETVEELHVAQYPLGLPGYSATLGRQLHALKK